MRPCSWISGSSGDWKRRLYVGAVAGAMFLAAACQQKMANQPYFRALEETNFFDDGRASRPLVPGTVTFEQLAPDNPLLTGLTPEGRKAKARVDQSAIPAGAPDDPKNYVDVFPFKMTEEHLKRGMERYTIYCTPCHGPLGDGNGKIVERGYLKPTSYHGENSRGFGRYRIDLPLKDAPVGYYFEVVSKGFGAMPDYSMQISPEDRWKIIAYIRALQFSQAAYLKDLPASVQEAAKKAVEHGAKETHGGH
jgi:mono/diheme cytochrome c family protein